jgi:hypothetical protein
MAFITMQGRYDSVQVIFNADLDLLLHTIGEFQWFLEMSNAVATLWWCVVFTVKLAYLFFFRRLVVRLRNLEIWWWFVVTFTIAGWVASLVSSWSTCQSFTLEGIMGK